MLSRSEDGSHCREMRPLLSMFCDGEASEGQEREVREHLRACGSCRATMRAYRAAPGAAAALVPALPMSRSLLERAHDFLNGIQMRLSGGEGGAATDSAVVQVAAAGGTRGAGVAAIAKLLAVCAGTAGGAAVCVATGVAPMPLATHEMKAPRIERVAPVVSEESAVAPSEAEPPPPQPSAEAAQESEPAPPSQPASPAETGAVEYAAEPLPAPTPEPPPSSESSGSSSGSAAGEFGP